MIYIRYKIDRITFKAFSELINDLFEASYDALFLTDFCNLQDLITKWQITCERNVINGKIPKITTLKFDMNQHDSIVRLFAIHREFFDADANIYHRIIRDEYIANADKKIRHMVTVLRLNG